MEATKAPKKPKYTKKEIQEYNQKQKELREQQKMENQQRLQAKRKQKRPRQEQPHTPKLRTKIVVRRLPPTLPRDAFFNTISKWLDYIDWSEYVSGKLAKKLAKQNVFSRAYLNFIDCDSVLDFFKSCNGHLFVDSKGNEHRAVVEFAPFQRFCKQRKTIDPLVNTLDADADYQAFLQSLSDPSSLSDPHSILPSEVGIDSSLETASNLVVVGSTLLTDAETTKSTPLLDAIRAEKARKLTAKADEKSKKKLFKTSLISGNIQLAKRESVSNLSREHTDAHKTVSGAATLKHGKKSKAPKQAISSQNLQISSQHTLSAGDVVSGPSQTGNLNSSRKSRSERKKEKAAKSFAGAHASSQPNSQNAESTPVSKSGNAVQETSFSVSGPSEYDAEPIPTSTTALRSKEKSKSGRGKKRDAPVSNSIPLNQQSISQPAIGLQESNGYGNKTEKDLNLNTSATAKGNTGTSSAGNQTKGKQSKKGPNSDTSNPAALGSTTRIILTKRDGTTTEFQT
ncbi:hypothetical protein BATDEDRAFT_84963 [Batrachochytrium dendrobatidis JAM81]|uniref:UPF3 domain-containing protein n=1 Tax=Batrachochytrium dendrobatidis (strain JAM81 / FGSC 10211) TaxID=684364 RepID=F4NSD5_BATDJ|nr:uncharacterized protein BATDEDRAFT_84963 [Batrachochytrium dendrobatidis JAM81]EGF83414.1 hypothetical protein BATDEDRAFT_84963 [Batrachochytrium dendrobatidis JAM81]|eukprot:XP_006676092.1 hypothetical protein BATDEDRAFT_84963 [Batrachochytrium dendrobatidis JAM81]